MDSKLHATIQCINRIRLEFKVPLQMDCLLNLTVLIESDWNLKFSSAPGNSLVISSINRIRLEFKESRIAMPT